nr:hypothetical protein CFP56_72922 [Quercus suber]
MAMDLTSPKYFQAQSMFASNGEPPLEGNTSFYGKSNDNPFVDTFPDPLCKLNLKETSDFVKSFPMANNITEGRGFLEEPPLEGNTSFYGKSNDNPFVDTFPDPLCKLNLKETSDFVKSFPMANNITEGRGFLEVSAQRKREGVNSVTLS